MSDRVLPTFDRRGAIPTLSERWPCLPGERHTFAAGSLVCLCGRLSTSRRMVDAEVAQFHATGETDGETDGQE